MTDTSYLFPKPARKKYTPDRGLVSETEGDNMTSQAGHHGWGSQLHPNQIKVAGENVLSCLRTLFQILSSICFRWELPFLYTMAFMLIHAQGEEQTGICKLMDPAIIWNISSLVNFESIDLCPCSSTEKSPIQQMNICIPHGHLNVENLSPDPLGPRSSSRAHVKVVVMMVLAIIGFAGRMLYRRCRAFTEADINEGLMSEPAVPKRSDPTFEIHPSIE